MQHHTMPQSAHEREHRERERRAHAVPETVPTMHLILADIYALATQAPALTASIYLPTHRSGSDRQQDHTRAKNLLHEAQRMLVRSAGEQRANAIVTSVTAALERPDFWAHPSEGLALFCREESFKHLWLPATMPEQAVVSQHYHIKPLMPLLEGDGQFYVLELTQHGIHLHAGSRYVLRALELPGAPTSIDEALGHTEGEHHTEVRTLNAGAPGSVRYFGTVGDERAKDRIKEFFRRIDTCICNLLHAERAPLITAGVEYLLPLYREVNHYPHLVNAGITGNSDLLPSAILHDRAWQAVAPLFGKSVIEARERYAQLRGGTRTSDDLPTVLRAAFQGRIEDIFVASDRERWGTYDAINEQVREHEPRWHDDDDLLNLAIITAISTRSQIHVVPQALMPEQSAIAAVFRY